MTWPHRAAVVVLVSAGAASAAFAQSVPKDYEAVFATLGKKGDFKDAVLKVNIPRNDLAVTIGKRPAPTPFGFGGWVAFTKGADGFEVMMGDLVLTEDEVNPVMSAVLDNGLQVTALHNHFFHEQPRIFYMHVHGRGPAVELAKKLKPAVDLIDRAAARASGPPAASSAAAPLTGAALAKIIGQEGEQTGPVYKITIGRPDIDLREHGASINARMGLNTWAAFTGTDGDAMVAGDVAMLEHEVTPVLKALRSNGIDVVAIHHHMTDTEPVVIFLHYFGTGPAAKLAQAVKAAVDLLGRPAARPDRPSRRIGLSLADVEEDASPFDAPSWSSRVRSPSQSAPRPWARLEPSERMPAGRSARPRSAGGVPQAARRAARSQGVTIRGA